MSLTPFEKAALTMTAELWNLLCSLPDHHPSDLDEHQRDVHNIQARIMARVARRSDPTFFTPTISDRSARSAT